MKLIFLNKGVPFTLKGENNYNYDEMKEIILNNIIKS